MEGLRDRRPCFKLGPRHSKRSLPVPLLSYKLKHVSHISKIEFLRFHSQRKVFGGRTLIARILSDWILRTIRTYYRKEKETGVE